MEFAKRNAARDFHSLLLIFPKRLSSIVSPLPVLYLILLLKIVYILCIDIAFGGSVCMSVDMCYLFRTLFLAYATILHVHRHN